MPSLQSNTLASFHQFIGNQLALEPAAQISPEQALVLWREFEESLSAIRDGLADEEAGRMRPADEVLREILNEHDEA